MGCWPQQSHHDPLEVARECRLQGLQQVLQVEHTAEEQHEGQAPGMRMSGNIVSGLKLRPHLTRSQGAPTIVAAQAFQGLPLQLTAPRNPGGLTCWVRSWKAREMSCLCSLLRLVSTSTMAVRSTPEPRRGLCCMLGTPQPGSLQAWGALAPQT